MSGHNKWSKIKHKKGSEDAKKSQAFGKISRLVMAAILEGGGVIDPSANSTLRAAISRAREINMPKENIERAIKKASSKIGGGENILVEGYGPGGVGILVLALSDSRIRTIQEFKNIFSRGGGNMAEPGAVTFLFERRIIFEVSGVKTENDLLPFINLGLLDWKRREGSWYLQVAAGGEGEGFQEHLAKVGFKIMGKEIVWVAKNKMMISSQDKKDLQFLLESLEEQADVLGIFTNSEENN